MIEIEVKVGFRDVDVTFDGLDQSLTVSTMLAFGLKVLSVACLGFKHSISARTTRLPIHECVKTS